MSSWLEKLLKPTKQDSASDVAETATPAVTASSQDTHREVASSPASAPAASEATGDLAPQKTVDVHAAGILSELRYEAEKRGDSADWSGTEQFFSAALAKWNELDSTRAQSEQWQAFDKARAKFQARHSTYLELRKIRSEREAACVEVEKLVGDASEEARQKYDAISTRWPEMGTIPAEYWEILEKRFKAACQKYVEFKKQYDDDAGKRQAAMERLGALGAELETLAASTDWTAAETRFAELEKEIISLGAIVGLLEEWKGRHAASLAAFQARKVAFEKARDEAVQNELLRLVALCEEMDKMAAVEDAKPGLNRVREMQASWNAEGPGTKEQKRELNRRFEKAKKIFYDKLALSRQAEDLARWENYAAKLVLCERAEALASETVIREVANTLKELRAEWKKIGSAPREKADEVWKRFDTACEAAYVRCKEFYDKLHEDRTKSLELKTALCEKAEALRDSTEWKATSDKLKDFQAEWKTLGRCEGAVNEEIYKRFRGACDVFFERLKVHRGEIDRVNEDRRKAKEALCVEAESLAALDWKGGFEKARGMQRKWKEIGPTRQEHEHALWERFNGLVEAFFTKIDADRPENLRKKEELVQKVKELLGNLSGDVRYNDLAENVKELIAQWNQIGPPPKEKEKELWDEFNAPVKEFYEKRQKFLDDSRRQRELNLAAKLELIAKIEGIAQANENWLKATDEVRVIQEEWKKVGAVPREREEDVKEHYHAACDAFFGHKREFFDQQRKDRLENLKVKRKLCERLERIVGIESVEEPLENMKGIDLAEELKAAFEGNSSAFASASNRKLLRSEAFDEIKRIQDDWKRAGPVPKEYDEKIYQRYRRACDAFFNSGKPRPPQQSQSQSQPQPQPPVPQPQPELPPQLEGTVVAAPSAQSA